MAQLDIELTDEQKKTILEFWNGKPDDQKPSMTELTAKLFGEEYDGRSKEGRAVKNFFAGLAIKPRVAQDYQPKEKKELSDEQKLFISNHFETMSAVEIAREIYGNPELTNLNAETRLVNEYIKSLNPINPFSSTDDVPTEEWRAPNTFDRCLARINKYLKMSPIDRVKISTRQTKEVTMLMRYLNIFRLEKQIQTYQTQTDRELFESVFIRYTFDKPDLTEEEVDQYIILANEAVKERKIQARSEKLEELLEKQTGTDDEHTRIAMSLVEAMGKCQQEYNSCIKRQQDLVNALKEKRSERISKLAKENASILNLIDLWKNEKTRIDLVRLAQLRKEKIKEEIDRLSNMSDVQCRILGLSKEEAINGT